MAKEIFISHSHNDGLFIDFINEFLIKEVLTDFKPDEISFTSDKERKRGKLAGQNNIKLFDEVAESKLFICCLSNYYLSSPFCLLEHGVAYYKYITDNASIEIIPITAVGFSYKNTLVTIATLQHLKVKQKNDLKSIFVILKNKFPNRIFILEDEFNAKLDIWFLKFSDLKRKFNKNISKNDILLNQIINSFNNETDIEFPFSFFCDRRKYEELSIKSAKTADNLLIWTLFKSPLLVEDAYISGQISNDYLTDYDKFFKESEADERYRLIIFENFIEAEEYHNCDNNTLNSILIEFNKNTNNKIKTLQLSNLIDRKSQFETSNDNLLYFTTKNKIMNWYTTHFSIGNQIPSHFDYEFAHLASSKATNAYFGFTSGFHNNVNSNQQKSNRHMIFYPGTIQRNLLDSFKDRQNPDYHLFYDIPIQLELIEQLMYDDSALRKDYIIKGKLDNYNINKLK